MESAQIEHRLVIDNYHKQIMQMSSAYDFCGSPEKPLGSHRQLPLKTRRTPKLTVVLDLDETLVHSEPQAIENPDHVVTMTSGEFTCSIYVKYRPGLLKFLEACSQLFELVVFTASTRPYADSVIDSFDPERRLIKHRLYRESCREVNGFFLKDLRVLGRDLSNAVIVDNSVMAYSMNLANGIPILSWFNDQNDRELESLFNFLLLLKDQADVRTCLNNLFELDRVPN